jgi:hypothetical protein
MNIFYKDVHEDKQAAPCVLVRYFTIDGGETWMTVKEFKKWKKENPIIQKWSN